ncbi:Engulfment and cell motility protein 2 [Lachnellula arida]|uniref:Engulfment and cell motility protein 2 n=1 Tax=Lachnellula arida TaxID=1316785 RepID=A0A8T9B0Y2_9HELO|nr:Engulfment and cell motility protein 2 [Lachnellula arida]
MWLYSYLPEYRVGPSSQISPPPLNRADPGSAQTANATSLETSTSRAIEYSGTQILSTPLSPHPPRTTSLQVSRKLSKILTSSPCPQPPADTCQLFVQVQAQQFDTSTMDAADIPSLLSRLSSDEDAMRKMAVFKLQSSINDPSFADLFIASNGLIILRRLIMNTGGNTLAYSLQSLTRLLEVDMGWEIFETSGSGELVERVVELIVTHPLVNILRGAMSILVAIVSHPQNKAEPGAFGFRALKPAVAVYPQFFEMVVSQLNSADHALCANALMLLNALMRDSIQGGPGKSGQSSLSGCRIWGSSKRSALQDLAHPLLEFQALTKVLLRKWRDVKVDLEKPEHRRALKGLHLASAPERKENGVQKAEELATANDKTKGSRRHNPEKWRRLGFETESPAWEFDQTGFLGMMDLTDFVRKHEDGFQKLLLEQSSKPMHERCPIARASLAVTVILYEHFEVDKSDVNDAKSYLVLDGMKNYDKIFRPLLLQWSRLHTASLHAFFRLWKSTGAEQADFDKVAELVRILIEQVVGQASRTVDVQEVEEELADFEYARLRELQMEILELTFEDEWGQHLHQVRDELKHEALQFVKEQRIRSLLQGAWFPRSNASRDGASTWRFVKLSHNRRFLHYADFMAQRKQDPLLDELPEKIDLSTISSVVSNVSASNESSSSVTSSSTITKQNPTTTKITINSFVSDSSSGAGDKERAILTLMPITHSSASEWLDGLLMLLNQAPITAETNKLVALVGEYGLKIRLLNVREDGGGNREGGGVVPGREGVDEEYWFEV